MAELSKGHTYNPGDIVDAADLNSLVDAATSLKGIIMDQPSATPVTADDSLLFHDLSSDNLARCKISALGAGTVTSVGLVANPTSVFGVAGSPVTVSGNITLSLDPQVGNKVLASPLDGSSGVPAFRVLNAADITLPPISVALYLVDFTLGNYFVKILPDPSATRVLTLKNGTIGQSVKVRVDQNPTGGASILSWTASGNVMWPGGVQPVLSTGASHRDIFEFVCTGTETYFGIRWGANFS